VGNPKAEITLEWGDGEYLFALKGKEIEELEQVCGKVGFGAIYQRVSLGVWFWGDLYHTVRLGLIGGGMGAIEAKRLTDMYIGRERPGMPLVSGPNSPESVAQAVLKAVMHGFEDIEPGEAPAGGSPAKEPTSAPIVQPS
jgi:hypothetical protein